MKNKVLFITLALGLSMILVPLWLQDNLSTSVTASTVTETLASSNTLIDQEFIERYVYNVIFSPNYTLDHTVFATVWGSGLYKSVDQGNTWMRVQTSSEKDHQMAGLAISSFYSVDSTIFAGFYDLNRSENGGSTWERLWQFGGNSCITNIAFSPNFVNDHTIYVATYGGSVIRNTTGGDGWWEQLNPEHFFDWSVAISPNFVNDSTLFVGSAGGGIKRSTDRGDTWEHVSGGEPYSAEDVRSIEISPSFQQDGTVFAATSDYGVLKSVDGGSSWGAANNGLSNLGCRTLALSPNFSSDDIVFVGTADGIFKSADAGDSWFPISNGLTTPYVHTIAISPNFTDDEMLFSGTEEGLFKSIDGGLSWLPANNGLQVTTIPNITKSPFIGDVQPSIAIGSDGILHLAWLGLYTDATAPDGVVEDIFYMRGENNLWSNPVTITAPTGYYATNLSLAVDSDGHPHIAFRRSTHQSSSLTEDDIYYTVDYGSGFLDPVLVVDGGYDDDWLDHPYAPSLAIDNAGIAHIAYLAGYTGNVWYTTNQNGSFNTPIQVISDSIRSLGVDLSVGNDSKVHLAIDGVFPGANPEEEIYYINNLSGSFSESLQVSEGGGNNPIISLDSQGKVHIAFYYFPFGGAKQIGYATNKTGSFGSPQYIKGYHHPSMALDLDGNVHIAAQQQTVNPWEFFINQIGYANNIGGEFVAQTITDLSSGIATAQRRYIAIGPDDSVHIVYANGTIGGYDLFHLSFYPTPFALAVTKQANPDPVQSGAPLTYTIRITNTGSVTLTATITDTLPDNIAPGETPGGTLILPSGVITWSPVSIAPGSVWTETVIVTVEMEYAGLLTNVVEVTTEEGATGIYTETSTALFTPLNRAPYTPSSPIPADSTTDVPITQTLSWQGGDPDGDGVTYAVAFGIINPPPMVATTTQTNYTPSLITNTTYYWLITATDGLSTSIGATWTFSTADVRPPNQAPNTPSSPVPADEANDVPTNQTLSWQGGDPDDDVVTYTVAFGAVNPPPIVATATQTDYTPSLITNTTYYWLITATDGLSTSVGATWTFTTSTMTSPEYKVCLPAVLKE